ncbi:TetR/AcrR family transcriptional regulator [Cryobacterium sp. PH29-G1]|uniref:TetR/AcrR family transcriptional regulator n=1 Tax=Cryobacterium sp. PH29-G1 TaxID=3046211 RepID=UPI0024BAE967|nr:TetR/AcrR family transcriptional regulator [Cryobacterium sp. PH29-G1]MDJ0350762.1 TetR/AcrR family transcriptional regulator [Cryobacterium sp. PH29-G1]
MKSQLGYREPQPGNRLGLRDRTRLQRFADIRSAAERLLREKSFDDITTKEVAELAGVGEATLFRYISNKRELLLLVLGHQVDSLIDRIMASDAVSAPGDQTGAGHIGRVKRIYEARAEFYVTDPETVTSYLEYGFKAGSQLGAESIIQGDRIIGLTESILRRGQELKVLMPDVDARTVAQNCNSIYIHEIFRTSVRNFTPETLSSRVASRLSAQLVPLVLDRRS